VANSDPILCAGWPPELCTASIQFIYDYSGRARPIRRCRGYLGRNLTNTPFIRSNDEQLCRLWQYRLDITHLVLS